MADMQYGPRRPGHYGAYEKLEDGRPRAALAETEARALAEKYDVSRLSRNSYSLLLRDLRSDGYITAQAFSAGYGGTLPRGAAEPSELLPLGDNQADFTALLEQYVRCCDEFLRISAGDGAERAHAQSLLDTYSRLYALFRQIHDAAPEVQQETEN